MMRQLRFDRLTHRALGQHDLIMPEPQLVLHAFERACGQRRQLERRFREHFERVTKLLGGDTELVRVLRAGAARIANVVGKPVRVIGEGAPLPAERFKHEVLHVARTRDNLIADRLPVVEATDPSFGDFVLSRLLAFRVARRREPAR